MKFKKPQLIPLIFITATVILLFGFGTWQLVRLQWKEDLLQAIEKAQSEPALGTIPQDLSNLEYRNVVLTGAFLNEKALHEAGGKQGMPPGFFILTPFILEDDGRTILVNRGFAPQGKETSPEGLQTVRGVIRPPRTKRPFSPENHTEKNIWFYEDIDAMSQVAGRELMPLVVEATGKRETNIFPIPNDGNISLRNDHLGYAITWYLLAVIALIMFALYHREKE